MSISRFIRPLIAVAVVAGLAVTAYLTRDRWLPWLFPSKQAGTGEGEGGEQDTEPAAAPSKIIVNELAQENLGLTAKMLRPRSYWKTIAVPGMVVDRPGLSDRGVTAPVAGVVTGVARVPGDAVRPGDTLFTLKVLSESLHQTQADLFKATQEVTLVQAQKKRLRESAGVVPEARLIEVDNQLARFEVAVKAYRQELLSRGFTPDQIDGVTAGTFIREVTVAVPTWSAGGPPGLAKTANPSPFEVQELKVELGQQVQAGQPLCTLASHQSLAVEGRAFRDETPLLERSVTEKWSVEVDFQEEPSAGWGEVKQEFRIRHLSNTIDPQTRTFAFLLPLANESRTVEDDGHTQTLWRFRPGQKVRLHVRIEELKDVFVLPADAVTRDGADSFLFTQNVNTFTRHPVRVLLRDRDRVVLANDGSFPAGTFAVQSGAAQLNRMIRAGGAGGVPKGYHMHADGSLHKNEDEGK